MYNILDLISQLGIIFASPYVTLVVQWVKATFNPPKTSYRWLALGTSLVCSGFLAYANYSPEKVQGIMGWIIFAGSYLVAGLISWQAAGKFWDEYKPETPRTPQG